MLLTVAHKNKKAPEITQSNSGIPVINIADANKSGISNNYFTDFNVGKEGLIFNNSKELFTNTVLAGYINGNSNLTNEASLILGQVTGTNTSLLLGSMEIAGKKADLIIANPNGITCQGCGVINANSFTLSTGTISQEEIDRVENATELQKHLTVITEKGHIAIEALNASNTPKLNLIAKSIQVNGALLAQDLQMILGANQIKFDLNNSSDASLLLYEPIKTKDSQGQEQIELGLDVAYLGSVTASNIYLVSTQEGVGVKNSGSMASIGSKESGDGGFVIDVNGNVSISAPQQGKSTLDKNTKSPSLISNADLKIRAKSLVNESIISTGNDINITADRVENKSRYTKREVQISYHEDEHYDWGDAGWYNDEEWRYEERIDFFSPAIIQANGNMTIQAKNIKNDMGNLESDNKLDVIAKEKFENIKQELQTRTRKKRTFKPLIGKRRTKYDNLYYEKTVDKKEEFWGVGASIGVNNEDFALEGGIGIANTETISKDTLYKTSTSSSNINADTINITTKGNKKAQGDINIIGSNLNGKNIALTGKNVNIKAHETISKESHTRVTQTKFQTGMYGEIGLNGLAIGIDRYGTSKFVNELITPLLPKEKRVTFPPQNLHINHQASNSTLHTGSNLTGNNITINSDKNTNIIGSSINASGETNISGKNVNVIASIDKKTEYGGGIDYEINGKIGASLQTVLDARLDAYGEGKLQGSASTNVNNASINSGNLTINTTKEKVDMNQAKENHKEIGKNLKKLAKNIGSYIQAQKNGNKIQGALALGNITANGLKTISSIKNSIDIDVKNLNSWLNNSLAGNVNIIGGNLNANNVNMDVKGDLNIGSIQSHSASGDVKLQPKTKSSLSAVIAQPINVDESLGVNLSATTKEQAGIKADKVNITTNRNTSLSNAYISATNKESSIQTNTMTKLDFKDINLNLNQNINLEAGLILGEFLWKVFVNKDLEKIKNGFSNKEYIPAIKKASELIHLNISGGGIGMEASTTSHPSSISKNIKVEVDKNKKEPKNIFRGEAKEGSTTTTISYKTQRKPI